MAYSRITNRKLAIRGTAVQHEKAHFTVLKMLFSVLISRRIQVRAY
jgi:hypothetical protein